MIQIPYDLFGHIYVCNVIPSDLTTLTRALSYLSGSRSRLDWVAGKKAWCRLQAKECGEHDETLDAHLTLQLFLIRLRPSFLISCQQLDIAFTASYQGNSILIGRGSDELKPIQHHFSVLISPV